MPFDHFFLCDPRIFGHVRDIRAVFAAVAHGYGYLGMNRPRLFPAVYWRGLRLVYNLFRAYRHGIKIDCQRPVGRKALNDRDIFLIQKMFL